MITLKFRAYSIDELDALFDVLENGMLMVQNEAGENCHTCKTCPYRRICNDIEYAMRYVASEIDNRTATRR